MNHKYLRVGNTNLQCDESSQVMENDDHDQHIGLKGPGFTWIPNSDMVRL